MADINTKEIAQALMHAGISGQKWYQRRYQNPDGTYTELGKIRKRAYYRDNYSTDYELSRQNPKTLSNEDLRRASDRYNIESNYSKNKTDASLLNQTANKAKVGLAAVATLAAAGLAGYKIYNIVKNRNNKEEIEWGKKASDALRNARKNMKAEDLENAFHDQIINQVKSSKFKTKNFAEDLKDALKDFIKQSDIDEDYLAHHGILGQKWGIRRFQNDDGTLTPLGRKRYGVKTYNELSASQKRDIEKRDAELRTRQETDYQNKMLAKQQKREYKLEKQKLKNEAAENKSAERVEKAEIESAREERLQAETNEKAQKTVKAIAIGLAATTAVLGFAVARKAGVFSKGTATASSSGNRPKVDIGSKGRDAESRFNVLKGLFSKAKNSGAGKSAGESVKAAFVKAKDVPKAARTSAGKTVFETFRDSDGLFKSAADILRNHPGQLRLATP